MGADRRAHCVQGCPPAIAVNSIIQLRFFRRTSADTLKKGRGLHLAGCPVNFRTRRSGAPAVRGVIRYVMHGPPVRFPCLSPPWSGCHLPVGARIVSSLGGWQRVRGVKCTIPCISGWGRLRTSRVIPVLYPSINGKDTRMNDGWFTRSPHSHPRCDGGELVNLGLRGWDK